MGDIVDLPVVTTLDCDADKILASAMGNLESVVNIGYDNDENEFFASSIADGGTILWLMERFKKMLLAHGDIDQG